jgi:hypothetical protein
MHYIMKNGQLCVWSKTPAKCSAVYMLNKISMYIVGTLYNGPEVAPLA